MCTRCERPRSRAADEHDKLATLQLIEAHQMPRARSAWQGTLHLTYPPHDVEKIALFATKSCCSICSTKRSRTARSRRAAARRSYRSSLRNSGSTRRVESRRPMKSLIGPYIRGSPRASNRTRSASWIDGAGSASIWLYQFDDIDVGSPPRLTGLVFRDLQASVISALPMDDQSDLVGKDIDNDL